MHNEPAKVAVVQPCSLRAAATVIGPRSYGRGKRLLMDEKDRSASLTNDSDIRA